MTFRTICDLLWCGCIRMSSSYWQGAIWLYFRRFREELSAQIDECSASVGVWCAVQTRPPDVDRWLIYSLINLTHSDAHPSCLMSTGPPCSPISINDCRTIWFWFVFLLIDYLINFSLKRTSAKWTTHVSQPLVHRLLYWRECLGSLYAK